MNLLKTVGDVLLGEDDAKCPAHVEDRIKRGRERLRLISAEADEAFEFYRGNHYCYIDENRKLQTQSTVTSLRGAGKPRHRVRQKRAYVFDIVVRARSLATSRPPAHQVIPSTPEPEDVSAAQLSEKVARYGYGRWGVNKAKSDVVTHAVVSGEGFGWAYFDNTIGPFIPDPEGGMIGEGDIRVRVYGRNECYWEPGVRFENSPWHVIEQARPVHEVEAQPHFFGKPLKADADVRSLSNKTDGNKNKLVLVSDYLERPNPTNPKGKWVTLANGRRIIPDRDYPTDDGTIPIRPLSYARDPDSDRDIGLVPQILDPQRQANDANNKVTEWKNLALNPQVAAHPGTFKDQRWTDEPGKVYDVPHPNENIRVIEPPQIPSQLFEIEERAHAMMARVAAQNDIPSQVESGKGVIALLDADEARSTEFFTGIAEWDSQIMHDCLVLVQKHFTEPRLLKIKGDFGWESIKDFQGAQLRDQVDVRVSPDDIMPRSKRVIEQRVMTYADRGWISPEQAMTAIEQGSAESVIKTLAFDEARAGRIIRRIKEGPESLAKAPEIPTGRLIPDPAAPLVPDPLTGEMVPDPTPVIVEMAPAWMPRYSDNIPVFKGVFESWMKTEEFERLDPEMQQAAATIYQGILNLESEKAAAAQAIQTETAEQLGLANATRSPSKPLPSMPDTSNDPGTP